MFKRERIIYVGRTAFEQYQVVDMVYEGRPARVLFTNNHRAAQSGVAKDGKPELLFDYNQRFFELATSIQPKSILVIGGGAYTLPMALVEALPNAGIDVIEIDTGLDAIARQFFGLTRRKQLNIIHTDGRKYLETTMQKYDLIIVDAFNGTRIPYGLVTIESVTALRQCLGENGIAAVNVIGTYYGRSMLLKGLAAAYQKVFKRAAIHPANDAIPLLTSQNFVLVGQKNSRRTKYHLETLNLTLPAATARNLLFDSVRERWARV